MKSSFVIKCAFVVPNLFSNIGEQGNIDNLDKFIVLFAKTVITWFRLVLLY